MQTKHEILASVPMFHELAHELLAKIVDRCIERTYSRGETVFAEGERAKGLIVVWRGALKIFKISDGGREQILEIEGPGRTVALMPLFDGLPLPASCAAIEESVLLTMPTEVLHRLVAGEPALSLAIIADLSRRLRHMVSLVEEISLKGVRTRLSGFLSEIAGDETIVQLTLNNQEIAARIGTVREIVSRTFGRMVHEGVISLEGRTLTILNKERL